MNKEELIEFLRENLTLEVDQETQMYSQTEQATITLKLEDHILGQGWITIDPGDPQQI